MVQSLGLDFHDFHLLELPALLAGGHGQLAALAARELEPLSFRISGTDNAYTYQPTADTIKIIAGTEAQAVIDIDLHSWQSLVCDLQSKTGLLCSDKLSHTAGNSILLAMWEPVLRAMFHGRPLI